MSYSFTVRGATKALALAAVQAQMQAVVEQSPCHQADAAQAVDTAKAYIDVLPDQDAKDVVVTLSGSLAGQWVGNDLERISSAGVSVSASLAGREA